MDINALIKQVKDKGKDQSQASSGGGDFEPIAAGVTGARLVGYYEVGQHESEFEGKKKINNTVKLVFELIGKKHPPIEKDDGTKIPVRSALTLNLSNNEKAGFFKIFSRIRDEDTTHMMGMLGKPVMLTIVHVTKKVNGKDKTYANIDKESIKKPIIQEMGKDEDGEPNGEITERPFPVGPALSELKAFVWDFASPEMWDAIFIEGEYPERKDDAGKVIAPARSKNTIQNEIASAVNFKGLPCYDYAVGKLTREDADALDDAIGDVVTPEKTEEPAARGGDPLEGIA